MTTTGGSAASPATPFEVATEGITSKGTTPGMRSPATPARTGACDVDAERRCCPWPYPVGVMTTVAADPSVPDALGLDAWRVLRAAQQPTWPDEAVLREVALQLAGLPPLVVASEVDQL